MVLAAHAVRAGAAFHDPCPLETHARHMERWHGRHDGPWLGFKSERAEAIAMLGGSDVVDHAALDGSKTVAVSVNVADVDAMMATLASPPPEVAAVMERHGVMPPLVAYVEG